MNLRKHRWLFIGVGLFLVANIAFFVTYRVRYEERLQALEATKQEAARSLDAARRARVDVERQLAGYEQVKKNIATVHQEHFSTSEERLPAIISEVRSLASKAGLAVTSIAYDVDQQKRELDSLSMTISFDVVGSYEQIRRLINMIELSNQFLIIDEISLNDSAEANRLRLSIQLKTLFHDQPADERGI